MPAEGGMKLDNPIDKSWDDHEFIISEWSTIVVDGGARRMEGIERQNPVQQAGRDLFITRVNPSGDGSHFNF